MSASPTFPGVYVTEIPSGVRTIAGVSTSTTVFIGTAARGPLNRAVRVTSFADFERRFGGLDRGSELSYAVRQFYANGGAIAIIVRIAANPARAGHELLNGADTVLRVDAVDEGAEGNTISLSISHATRIAGSNFDLTVSRQAADAAAPDRVEEFTNLSMNSNDARWVEDLVNGISDLVTVKRDVEPGDLAALPAATSTSAPLQDDVGALLDVANLVDATHNQLQVVVNGLDPVEVVLPVPPAGGDEAARLDGLCAEIQQQVRDAGTTPALAGFTCAAATARIVMTSGAGGEPSSVRALAGVGNDASARLRLGSGNGGEEVDGVAAIRPDAVPEPGALEGTTIATLPANRPSTQNALLVGLDGRAPVEVSIGTADLVGATVADRATDAAARLQAAVRAANPANPAFTGFTASSDAAALTLRSGTRGPGSAVVATAAEDADIAATLGLLAGATATAGRATSLTGGNEDPFDVTDPAAVIPLVLASRADRKGLYALESVDLFNLLCLPGISDPTVLADAEAYCRERRAFLVVDPPADVDDPTEMETLVGGTALPRSNHAAVYWPWLEIGDPLRPGRTRMVPPSGTVAGIMARTDASRGVWKAPAGTEATMVGVQDLGYVLTDRENGVLNPLGVNSARIFRDTGPVVWGARTLRGDDDLADEYKYVPVRRIALMIEESLYRGTQWAVFEPNDERLWSQLRLNIGAFMNGLFRQGAFQGASPRDAYLVKVDAETTTQADVNRGIVNILVGFAPLRPAEFVMIQVQQLAGQVQA